MIQSKGIILTANSVNLQLVIELAAKRFTPTGGVTNPI